MRRENASKIICGPKLPNGTVGFLGTCVQELLATIFTIMLIKIVRSANASASKSSPPVAGTSTFCHYSFPIFQGAFFSVATRCCENGIFWKIAAKIWGQITKGQTTWNTIFSQKNILCAKLFTYSARQSFSTELLSGDTKRCRRDRRDFSVFCLRGATGKQADCWIDGHLKHLCARLNWENLINFLCENIKKKNWQ